MAPTSYVASLTAVCFLGLGGRVTALPPAAPGGHNHGHSAGPSQHGPHGHWAPSSTANLATSSSNAVTTASSTATSASPYSSAGFVAFTDMKSAQLQSVYNSYTSSVSASANSGISSMSAKAAASCDGMDYMMSYYMSSLTTATASSGSQSETASATASMVPRALYKRFDANQQSCTVTDGVDLGGNVGHYTVEIGLNFDNGGGCSAIQNALAGMLDDQGFSFFSCNALDSGNNVFTELLFKINLGMENGAKINAALESVTNGRVQCGFNCPDL